MYGLSNNATHILKILLKSYKMSLDGKNIIKIEKGVPQGSILSHILFSIFLNSLLEEIE